MFALGITVPAFLSGCADFNPDNLLGNSSASQPPTFNQNEAVTLVSPFSMKIERSYWTKTLDMGFGTPSAVSSAISNAFKPSAEFLVIDFTITNLSTQGVAWRRTEPPIFVLVNSQGIEYLPAQVPIADSISSKLILTTSINPGMSLKGNQIFDVPKGEYTLKVTKGRYVGGTEFVKGPTLFNWNLKPSQR